MSARMVVVLEAESMDLDLVVETLPDQLFSIDSEHRATNVVSRLLSIAPRLSNLGFSSAQPMDQTF